MRWLLVRTGGIWYRFTTGNSAYNISASFEVFTANQSHAVDIFKAAGNGSIFELVFIDEGGYVQGGTVETARFTGTPQTTYYFRISRLNNRNGSPVEVTINASPIAGTSPAAIRATLRRSLNKLYLKLRKANSDGKVAQVRKIRRQIRAIQMQLRRS